MQTRVQKWGNSLALRIPKLMAHETHLEPNTLVDVTLVDGSLVVSPVRPDTDLLEQMLTEVTEENLHGEWPTGTSVGQEVW